MADKATKERLAADMKPPNYREAIARIRSIDTKKDRIAAVTAEIGEIWAKVEGHKVDKKAGKIFQTLDKLDDEDRVTVLRDINGLCDAAGWSKTGADLVDKAQNNVVSLRVGEKAAAGDEGGDDDDDDQVVDDQDGDDGDVDPPAAPASDPKAALERARKRISGNKPAAEPYTGDNSDLAGD